MSAATWIVDEDGDPQWETPWASDFICAADLVEHGWITDADAAVAALAQVIRDAERFRQHSMTLNQVIWRLATLLDLTGDDLAIEADALAIVSLIEALIKARQP